MKYIDFHMHTTYSDGASKPEEVVRSAKANGLDAIAITDHDNIRGFREAIPLSAKENLILIPGVEITTLNYHILGLMFNPDSPKFLEFMKYSEDIQEEVTKKRIKKLRQAGIPITFERVRTAFPNSRLGKLNIFRTIVSDEKCWQYIDDHFEHYQSDDELFAFLLGKNGIAGSVEKSKVILPDEAIREIHEAEGLAILAHPFLDVKGIYQIRYLLYAGLDGIEVQPHYRERNAPYEQFARRRGLPITVGSDYHGTKKPMLVAGQDWNSLNLEDFEKARRRWRE